MKSFFIALRFLTILPFGKNFRMRNEDLAKAASWFPLAGALVGLLLVAVDFVLRPIFSDLVINIFILITLVVVTGALHVDGFIDSVDGLFSGRGRKRSLEIMSDSRAGAFGMIAIIFLLLLKLVFLNELQSSVRYLALIFMPTISRWAAVYAIYKYPHAKTKGAGEVFANLVGPRELVVATLIMLIFAGLLLQFRGFIVWFVVFIILHLLNRWINKKLGGLTGDIYGGVVEITEVIVLISVYLLFA